MSLWIAMRLRSRQTICITGSSPCWHHDDADEIDDMRTTEVWLSVMLNASAFSLSSAHFLRITPVRAREVHTHR